MPKSNDKRLVKHFKRHLPASSRFLQKVYQITGSTQRDVPEIYDENQHLIELNMRFLGLTHLPSEIGQFRHLKTLIFCDNKLVEIPPEIGDLTSLEELNLGYNQLTHLPPEIGNLTNLKKLYLWHNHLTCLPPEIGNLANLQELYLWFNELVDLPPEIGNLRQLRIFQLIGNPLTSLPPEIGNLSKLEKLEIDTDALYQPPPEITTRGTQSILAYLRALQKPTIERYEAKLILVGEGRMGKSSLLRRLQGQPFNPSLPLTHGIDVEPLLMPHPYISGKSLTLHTWDFGGQILYQATHQFFLTLRSLYLLVWNIGQDPEVCRLSFWLETIRALAPDARILLVATHADEWYQNPLDLSRYQRDFPQIEGQCIISNKDGYGLDQLIKQITLAAVQNPLIGQSWPRTWVEAEKELLAHPEQYMDRTTFLQICSKHQIDSADASQVLGPFLHDLGKILFFSDDSDPGLSNLVVLRPNWISKIVSQVLSDHYLQQSGGLLPHRQLPRIWATDEQGHPYDPKLYPVFFRLMERFDLCFQLEPQRPGGVPTHSLIPLLLPLHHPTSLPEPPAITTLSIIRIQMRYTLDFVPAGLISWMIVRAHRYIRRQPWREGVHLDYQEQQARVELDSTHRELHLIVWGTFPYTFFILLKEIVENLLEPFKSLRIKREIPCICREQQYYPHWHTYDQLEKRFRNGETKIRCEQDEYISLSLLLYGIHTVPSQEVALSSQEMQQLLDQQTKVLAGEMRQLLAPSEQKLEFIWHNLLRLISFEMQKEQKYCPGVFILEEERNQHFLHPINVLSRSYRVHLLCQFPSGPHILHDEQGYLLHESRKWWKVMSPWLRRLITVLKVGIPLAKDIGEIFDQAAINQFATQVTIFDDIINDISLNEPYEDLKKFGGTSQIPPIQDLEGAALRQLFYFLDKTDPSHYWQGLSQVTMPNGDILWMCEKHKQNFVPQPLIWR